MTSVARDAVLGDARFLSRRNETTVDLLGEWDGRVVLASHRPRDDKGRSGGRPIGLGLRVKRNASPRAPSGGATREGPSLRDRTCRSLLVLVARHLCATAADSTRPPRLASTWAYQARERRLAARADGRPPTERKGQHRAQQQRRSDDRAALLYAALATAATARRSRA
jgi:hypothetical protein